MVDSLQRVKAQASEGIILDQITNGIKEIWDDQVAGIGIGVPSIVDPRSGTVYNVQNIPSWTEVELKAHIENIFHVRVEVNNDANCFALGEKWFGKGQQNEDLIGLVIGTGIAGGIIIDDRLYAGEKCGAGEFGMLPYKDHYFEYYCSGQFFTREGGVSGEELARLALQGDKQAKAVYTQFGHHMGNMIQAILYALAPSKIILGGSISKSYDLFQEAMYKTLADFAFQKILDALVIETSEHPDISVLGAAGLVSHE
ncbi:MAG: ROK family protein [Saprospiraceae bacterium]|nr:ROK family protein [Saprospiraceae bacterium]